MTDDRRRVYFVLFDLGYRGGIVRTVVNLANHLAEHHDVEIVSVIRQRDQPVYPVDGRVTVRYVEDRRPGQVARGKTMTGLAESPSKMFHPSDEIYPRASRLTDVLLSRTLLTLRPGYLVTTRPSLHLVAARVAPKRVFVIGQEHINFKTRSSELKTAYVAAADGLDALAVLTERDKADFERLFAGRKTLVEAIPNALSWPRGEPAPLSNKIVIAAGRLARQKGFDRLIDAYQPVARAHPDWQLHIYGSGGQRNSLQEQISRLGLEGSVALKGRTDEMAQAMAGAAIFALSSRFEGFPMVLLEAMSVGLPVVSFDCPRGPREAVTSGRNGYLVDNGNLAGFTSGLLALIEDEDARRAMGAAAFETAQAYEMAAVCRRWQDLFARLAGRPRSRSRLWQEGRRRLSGVRAARSGGAASGSPGPPPRPPQETPAPAGARPTQPAGS